MCLPTYFTCIRLLFFSGIISLCSFFYVSPYTYYAPRINISDSFPHADIFVSEVTNLILFLSNFPLFLLAAGRKSWRSAEADVWGPEGGHLSPQLHLHRPLQLSSTRTDWQGRNTYRTYLANTSQSVDEIKYRTFVNCAKTVLPALAMAQWC